MRPALNYIKDIGVVSLQKFLKQRQKEGPFLSLPHFYRCCRRYLSRRSIENLIKVGAFDYCGLNRRQLLFQLGQLLRSSDKKLGSEKLFEEESPIPDLPPFSLKEKLQMEKRLSDLFVSTNPLVPYRLELSEDGCADSQALHNLSEGAEAQLAGIVVAKKTEKTKRGERMFFALLEDEKEMFEVIFFPNLYQEAAQKVKKDRVLAVEGRVSWEGKEPKLIARALTELGRY